MLTHRGYWGSVRYSREDRLFHGKIEFIRALILYEGTSVDELEADFKDAVDDYLDLCAQEGLEPERPAKGSFNVRTSQELHRQAIIYAEHHNMSLNKVVGKALERFLNNA